MNETRIQEQEQHQEQEKPTGARRRAPPPFDISMRVDGSPGRNPVRRAVSESTEAPTQQNE